MQYDFIKTFMDEIREEMKAQNMNQNELSERSGVNVVNLSRMMNSKTNLNPKAMIKLANALGMRPVLTIMEND